MFGILLAGITGGAIANFFSGRGGFVRNNTNISFLIPKLNSINLDGHNGKLLPDIATSISHDKNVLLQLINATSMPNINLANSALGTNITPETFANLKTLDVKKIELMLDYMQSMKFR